MDVQKHVQAYDTKKFGQLIQVLNDSFQELLYSHIDPVIKQWMKTFHNCLIIGAELTSRLAGSRKRRIPSTVCQVNLDPGQRDRLGRGEETELIEGLVSKKGNRFAAYLHLDEQGALKFRFPEATHKSPVPGQVLGVALDKDDQALLEKGEETGLIRGMKGKRGIPFNAYLKMDASSKLQFRFEERGSGLGAAPDTPANAPIPEKPEKEEKGTEASFPGQNTPAQKGSALDSYRDTEIYGRKLETPEFDLLQTKGSTGLLEGFKTSSGKEFSARLEWNGSTLSIQIPQRQLDTGITMIPKKLFGVELSAQNRRLLAAGRSSERIQNLISPQGIRFDGWLEFNAQHHLCIHSAEKTFQVRKGPAAKRTTGMDPPA